MKAVICTKYGPPEVQRILETKEPVPKANEVLVRIRATAVTTSDCYVRSGKVPWLYRIPMGIVIGFTRPRQPILGMVYSGEIASAGKAVSAFRPGDKVFGFDRFKFGTYAEYKCVSMNDVVAPMPPGMSFEEAAAIPYGGLLALFYLCSGNVENKKSVLIRGASGAVGSAAVQIAKYFGARVTGICSTDNLDMVSGLGADSVIDYTKQDYLNCGTTFDLILDAVPAGAGKEGRFLSQCKRVLDRNGSVLSVRKGTPVLNQEHLIFLKTMIDGGSLRAVVDRVYPMEQIAEAHNYVESWHKKGNVIVRI